MLAKASPRAQPKQMLLALCLACAAGMVASKELTVGLLSVASDERYLAHNLEKDYPNAPRGRSAAAAQLALDDVEITLQSAGWSAARLVPAEAPDLAGLPAALDGLLKRGVRHIVLELPAAGVIEVAVAARGKQVMLVNAAAPEDALRGERCSPQLLHALPSHAMQADAMAQFLAARQWGKPLVLKGPSQEDELLLAAFLRSAKRFGLRPAAQRAFRLSNDPRERELGNVRLLTANVDHDVVVVLDAHGEFSRELPYRTMLPRPVAGSSGLTAQAWSGWYERHGAPQLNRRFFKRSGRAMGSYDWATWLATRAIVEAVMRDGKASVAQHLGALKRGEVALDGYKGQRLTFRVWDGQLRQPLLLVHGNGLAAVAPIEGFLHPRTALDTLGHDAAETGCRTP